MKKPVNKLAFWKNRIDTAQKEQYSVYVANDPLWEHIANVHKTLCRRYILPNHTVLDAGCGYGRASEWFREGYTGVDFSPDFIALAKKKYPEANFVDGDLKCLPFKAKEFDWAICVSIKAMIVDNLGEEEWKVVEKELRRVARKVLILEYTEPTRYEIIQ